MIGLSDFHSYKLSLRNATIILRMIDNDDDDDDDDEEEEEK